MTRLEKLAFENPARQEVLKRRRIRERRRSRHLVCQACGESAYVARDPSDVCEQCLVDMWNARDVIAGAFRAGKRTGLIATWAQDRPHDLPYPHLAPGPNEVPRGMPFARFDHRGESEDAPRLMQILLTELAAALATVLPCDPDGRADAVAILEGLGEQSGGYSDERHFLRLPRKALETIRDLWLFACWHSNAAYFQGFEDGRALLSRLNDGSLTAEGFAEEAADQVRGFREREDRIRSRARNARRRRTA